MLKVITENSGWKPLTVGVNACDGAHNLRWIADGANSISSKDPEFILGILCQARDGELSLNNIGEASLGPSPVWKVTPLHNVACNLASSIKSWLLPWKVDRVLGNISDPNIPWRFCNHEKAGQWHLDQFIEDMKFAFLSYQNCSSHDKCIWQIHTTGIDGQDRLRRMAGFSNASSIFCINPEFVDKPGTDGCDFEVSCADDHFVGFLP